jgi:hypothetical protein
MPVIKVGGRGFRKRKFGYPQDRRLYFWHRNCLSIFCCLFVLIIILLASIGARLHASIRVASLVPQWAT